MKNARIKLYSLSSCAHCKDVRLLLKERNLDFDWVSIDMLAGTERADTMRELKKYNAACTFPTLVVDEDVVVGFKKEKIIELLDNFSDTP